jgi:hypothetical protein
MEVGEINGLRSRRGSEQLVRRLIESMSGFIERMKEGFRRHSFWFGLNVNWQSLAGVDPSKVRLKPCILHFSLVQRANRTPVFTSSPKCIKDRSS